MQYDYLSWATRKSANGNAYVTDIKITLPFTLLTLRSSWTIFWTPPAKAMSNAVSPLLSLIVLSDPADTKARIAPAQNST